MKIQTPVLASQSQLTMFVLDVLRHDSCEQVASIVRMLNDESGALGWREFWPQDFSEDEVLSALEGLKNLQAIRVLKETEGGNLEAIDLTGIDIRESADQLWFGVSHQGKQMWERWQPPQALTN